MSDRDATETDAGNPRPEGHLERAVVAFQRRVEAYNDQLDDDPSMATHVPQLDPLFDWLEDRTKEWRDSLERGERE